jgi:HSP20 family protein
VDPRDPFAELFGERAGRRTGEGWQPSVDVFETEKAIVVRAEVAGATREDVRVTVDGDLLRIRGVRRPPAEAEVQRPHQMEIEYGPFERVIQVQIPFERDGVSAHLEEGLLTVTLPKRGPTRRQVPVERLA